MVILTITRSSWNTDNNTGNTLSSLFGGMDCEVHSLYLRSDVPKNDVALSYFRITEAQLFSTLASRRGAGSELGPKAEVESEARRERALYDWGKRWGGNTLWFAREGLWHLGKWQSRELDAYLDRIRPDIIFMPAFGCVYPYRVLEYAARRCGSKVVIFHTDDYYSLRQLRFSPLFWAARLIMRKCIRRAVAAASLNYCISQEQADEYSGAMGTGFSQLRKGASFDSDATSTNIESTGAVSSDDRGPLNLVFSGNISSGRWRTLVAIARAIDEAKLGWTLEVYSQNSLTPRISRAFERCPSLIWKGGIPSESLIAVQERARILVHVESLGLRERLETRLAFSTKLVDYFARRRCILAVGWSRSASIAYLIRNDAALVAGNREEILARLRQIAEHPHVIEEYAAKAWDCGRRNHDHNRIQRGLYLDMMRLSSGE